MKRLLMRIKEAVDARRMAGADHLQADRLLQKVRITRVLNRLLTEKINHKRAPRILEKFTIAHVDDSVDIIDTLSKATLRALPD